MKTYSLYQVDSFTDSILSGNPAGVISNADGLSDGQMQSIAKEMNCSETAFILNAKNQTHDLYIRYFTPTVEVPLCGHATIAAHYVRAIENDMSSQVINQLSGIGVLPIEITKLDDDYKITMTQGTPEISKPFNSKVTGKILDALNLSDTLSYPIQIISTGHPKVIIPLKSKEILDGLKPNMGKLNELSQEINCNGFYAFCLDSEEDNVLTSGRMFAPAIGINEDPVTGNASGPLGIYLAHHKIINPIKNKMEFITKQGEAMGRKGYVSVEITLSNDTPVLSKISGQARIFFKTSVEL